MRTSTDSLALDLFEPPLEPSGLVYDIARVSNGLGPGLRSVVYLKGCPLRCLWCPNPEGQAFRPEVVLFSDRCARCGRCELACDRGRHVVGPTAHLLQGTHLCDGCQDCAEICPFDALQPVGKVRTVAEVVALLAEDEDIYEATGGGVTLAGGEPLFQDEFTLALLRAIRERGWHVTLDTNGYAPPLLFADVLGLIDLLVFDLKETNSELHIAWTGVPLEPILDNLEMAAESGVPLWIRCPVVPLLNDRGDHWMRVGTLVSELPGPPRVRLEPHEPAGDPKRTGLGRGAYNLGGLEAPTAPRLAEIAEQLSGFGLEVSVPS